MFNDIMNILYYVDKAAKADCEYMFRYGLADGLIIIGILLAISIVLYAIVEGDNK